MKEERLTNIKLQPNLVLSINKISSHFNGNTSSIHDTIMHFHSVFCQILGFVLKERKYKSPISGLYSSAVSFLLYSSEYIDRWISLKMIIKHI